MYVFLMISCYLHIFFSLHWVEFFWVCFNASMFFCLVALLTFCLWYLTLFSLPVIFLFCIWDSANCVQSETLLLFQSSFILKKLCSCLLKSASINISDSECSHNLVISIHSSYVCTDIPVDALDPKISIYIYIHTSKLFFYTSIYILRKLRFYCHLC